MPSHHVVILLATYQGGNHLQAQLDSIATQKHADWSLIISDDGSTDDTLEIIKNFSSTQPAGRVKLVGGPRAGATANFLSLLDYVPSGAWAAFCDQDDKWFDDKLERAIAAFQNPRQPGHYAARTIIADAELRPLTSSRLFQRPLSFRNALVQACMAGNTSVFTPTAVQLLQEAAPYARTAKITAHDWWAYQVTSGHGAKLIHDPKPALLYRQHPTAEIGRNDTFEALTLRARKLFSGDFASWLLANYNSLTPLDLTPDSKAALLNLQQVLTKKAPQAVTALRRGDFYRQTRMATLALFISAGMGRLRA